MVHFPIGYQTCTSCDRRWYTVVEDKNHAKPPSAEIWYWSAQLLNDTWPPNLSGDNWNAFRSANCTLAYVSTWSEKKGQLRLAETLVEYYHLYHNQTREGSSWLEANLTVCFAGKVNDKLYSKTTKLLDSIGVRHHNFGVLSLVEQLALFHAAGRSALLTANDFSPRVVYLSLVSGARVFTTPQAQVADTVVDNDCLVTEYDFFAAPLQERVQALEVFMNRDQCKTFRLVQSILQEDIQYKPLIEKALTMWRDLNFLPDGSRNTRCAELYAELCQNYFSVMSKRAR